MDNHYANIARKIVQQFSHEIAVEDKLRHELPSILESYLLSLDTAGELSYLEADRISQLSLGVAIAALILQAASFGYDIYSDWELRSSEPVDKIERLLEREIRSRSLLYQRVSKDSQIYADKAIELTVKGIIEGDATRD